MKQFYSTISICVITLLAITPFSISVKPDNQEAKANQLPGLGFLKSLGFLDFGIQDVSAMFKNAAAVADTEGCDGDCRTPIAFWMLQSLVQCNQVLKADCPTGLVCCSQLKMSNDKSNYYRAEESVNDFEIPAEDQLILNDIMLKRNGTIIQNTSRPALLPGL